MLYIAIHKSKTENFFSSHEPELVTGHLSNLLGDLIEKNELDKNNVDKTQNWINSQNDKNAELKIKRQELLDKTLMLNNTQDLLSSKTSALNDSQSQLANKTTALNNAQSQLLIKTTALNDGQSQLANKTTALNNAQSQLANKTNQLNSYRAQITTLNNNVNTKKSELILSGSGLSYPNNTKGNWEKTCVKYNNKTMWKRNGWYIYRANSMRWHISYRSPTSNPIVVNFSNDTDAEWPWQVQRWNNPDIQIKGSVSLPINC